MKIARDYAAYQNAVSSAKHTEKNIFIPVPATGKVRGDAACISSKGAKKDGALTSVAALSKSIGKGAPADWIVALKQQVQKDTCEVSAEQIARRLMSGLQEGERIGRDHLFFDRVYGSVGGHETRASGKVEVSYDERAG